MIYTDWVPEEVDVSWVPLAVFAKHLREAQEMDVAVDGEGAGLAQDAADEVDLQHMCNSRKKLL